MSACQNAPTLPQTRGVASPEEFEEWRRGAFPFFERKIFLTHASVSPLPAATQSALAEYCARWTHEGQFDYIHDEIYRRCKTRLAALLRENQVAASPQEIAFAGSTSHALGIVATSLAWKAGDNCVVADGDFPANVVVWKNLQFTHGVQTRMIPARPAMDITLEDIEPLVDERTRIVSLASCNFLSGYAPDLKAIGQWLHERGVLLCVDAIQTLGAVRCDFSEVDFICADAHKWMLGPNGIALLYTRAEVLKTLRPMILGWLSTRHRDNWFEYDTTPIAGAERFEPGARNYLGIIGMDSSLGVLEALGVAETETRVVALRDFAAQKLLERGIEVLWPPTPHIKSGIVSFRMQSDTQTKKLFAKLDEKFALSLRADRDGSSWIRISSHAMNSEADLLTLDAQIAAHLAQSS